MYCLYLNTHTHIYTHKQLVNIGSQYSYSSEDQSEFLVVVSREFDESPRSNTKPTTKEKVTHTQTHTHTHTHTDTLPYMPVVFRQLYSYKLRHTIELFLTPLQALQLSGSRM